MQITRLFRAMFSGAVLLLLVQFALAPASAAPQQTTIGPGAFEVTRGTINSGTIEDIIASDDSDLSIRRSTGDIESIVQVVVFGNSLNAFPVGIDFTIEASVFARSQVNLEFEAYNFVTNEFDLMAVRTANRFVDKIETVSLAGDLTQYVTPASGSMQLRVSFVSPVKRQKFAANIDHVFWTIVDR